MKATLIDIARKLIFYRDDTFLNYPTLSRSLAGLNLCFKRVELHSEGEVLIVVQAAQEKEAVADGRIVFFVVKQAPVLRRIQTF